MNLVERLLKADTKKATELETSEMPSKRLAKVLGEEKPIMITLQEIPVKRMNDIQGIAINKKGKFDNTKTLEANAIAVTDGVISPNLKDEALMKHFGCATPKDLAILLFGNEVAYIADKLMDLSTYGRQEEEEIEEEIKN